MGTFCTFVGKFDRGQMFRRYCVRCVHNTAHLGDAELHCQFLEHRGNPKPKGGGEIIPDKEPSVSIPPDLRG